jgi:hypothetical protein
VFFPDRERHCVLAPSGAFLAIPKTVANQLTKLCAKTSFFSHRELLTRRNSACRFSLPRVGFTRRDGAFFLTAAM